MKKCVKCKLQKEFKAFGACKRTKGGYRNECKECRKGEGRSIRGLATRIYLSQKQCSRLRGHLPPRYNKEDLYMWLISQDIFEALYDNWANTGYKKLSIPSIDRLDNTKGYSFSNIRLMTWKENKLLGHVSHGKKVIQSKQDKIKAEYISAREAERQTGINFNSISMCCLNKLATAGGFNWKFKD